MAAILQNSAELKDWETYRTFMKERLKQLPEGPLEFFVTKDKLDFDFKGKPWTGRAVLLGPKGLLVVKQLKKEGILFRTGTCQVEGKDILVEELLPKLVKDADKTFKKLLLGYRAVAVGAEDEGDEDEADADTGDDGLEAQWRALKSEVTSRVKVALAAQPELRERVTALLNASVQQEKAGDWAGAIATFRTLAGELGGGAAALNVALQGAAHDGLKAWEKALGDVAREVDRLKKAVLDACREDPSLAKEAGKQVKKLDAIPRKLDKGLRGKLQEVGEARDAEAQARALREVSALLKQIAGALGKDPMIKSIDANPFLGVKVRLTATNALKDLNAKLSA